MLPNDKISKLTAEQQELLDTWDDLTKKDKKVLQQLIGHMLSLSLERRGRKEWMEAHGIVDRSKQQAVASA
jgi:hypothetical protein